MALPAYNKNSLPGSLEIDGILIRVDSDGRFCLNDLEKAAKASGVVKDIRPSQWLSLGATKELVECLDAGKHASDKDQSLIVRKGGDKWQGTFASLDLIYDYAAWISPAFKLKVYRTFHAVQSGTYQAPPKPTEQVKIAMAGTRLFGSIRKELVRLGIDANAAAISANQSVANLTGFNFLAATGLLHLEASNQQSLAYTPTELGNMRGMSAKKMNLYLAEAGLQAKVGDKWQPLPAAEGQFEILDTGKRHQDGTPIKQVKWYQSVLEMVNFDGI